MTTKNWIEARKIKINELIAEYGDDGNIWLTYIETGCAIAVCRQVNKSWYVAGNDGFEVHCWGEKNEVGILSRDNDAWLAYFLIVQTNLKKSNTFIWTMLIRPSKIVCEGRYSIFLGHCQTNLASYWLVSNFYEWQQKTYSNILKRLPKSSA